MTDQQGTTYTSSSSDSEEITLTIYNNNFGAVKENRRASLQNTHSHINFLDVAALIETDSILVKGVDILEMNYEYDLVNKSKLLEKYVGLTVYLQKNGVKEAYRLLSVSHGLVLEHEETKEIVLDPREELVLPRLPEGLIIRPAIVWKISPTKAEAIDVSYLTKGFSWDVSYVMNLKGDRLAMAGWVNIKNESGTTFPNARIKLIAGEVKRVEKEEDEFPTPIYSPDMIMASRASFEEKEFADYHLYALNERTTLKNAQSKQIRLFQAEDVPCQVYYECQTGWKRANIKVAFDNHSSSHMGFPLPKGIVKVYQEDQADGQNEFIGEDEIDHTPKNEAVTLHIGEAFDLVFEHRRTELQRAGRGHTAESHEVTIRNHKSGTANVKLSHYVYKRFWRVSETTHPYKKTDSNKLLFELQVPAGAEMIVRFTIEMDEKQMVFLET